MRLRPDRGAESPASAKPKRQNKPKSKADTKLVAAARELRDRYLERVNELPITAETVGKYDVARPLPARKQQIPRLVA